MYLMIAVVTHTRSFTFLYYLCFLSPLLTLGFPKYPSSEKVCILQLFNYNALLTMFASFLPRKGGRNGIKCEKWLFLTCDNTLVKTVSLDIRPLLWRTLRMYFTMIVFPLFRSFSYNPLLLYYSPVGEVIRHRGGKVFYNFMIKSLCFNGPLIVTFTFSRGRVFLHLNKWDRKARRDGEMSLLTWKKLLIKSFSLERRHLLQGNLKLISKWLQFPCSYYRDEEIFFNIYLQNLVGFGEVKTHESVQACQDCSPKKFVTLILVCTHPQATYYLFMPLKCS